LFCNNNKTRKVSKNQQLKNIERFRFRIVLYREVNSNKNIIDQIVKTDLQKLIDTVLIIETILRISNIKQLITEFSCVAKLQTANSVI